MSAERSLLCPTLHDEPPLRLSIFDEVFDLARLLLFSTPEEQELAARRFGVPRERARIVGAGVDEHPDADPEHFAAGTGIERPYALYVGRLDPSKGVDQLVAFHQEYRSAHPDGIDLVLLGGGSVKVPSVDGIHGLGFVPEALKHDALAGATVVVCPSPYESLSLAQLEAWTHGRPTLVSAVSPVLVGQSRRARRRALVSDADEYSAMLDYLARAEPLASAIGAQGRRYAHAAYSWEHVRQAWLAALQDVASGST